MLVDGNGELHSTELLEVLSDMNVGWRDKPAMEHIKHRVRCVTLIGKAIYMVCNTDQAGIEVC